MVLRVRLRGVSSGVEGRTWESNLILRAGRLASLEVVLDDISVSRRHAEVRHSGTCWVVRDLGSTNGTFLNGSKVAPGEWPINNLDEIRFGDVKVAVEIFETADFAYHKIDGSPVGRFPISEDAAESIHIPTYSDSPIYWDVAPPNPGKHPVLWNVTNMARRIRLRGVSGGVAGRTWESSSILRVGRLASLEVVLDETSVSRRHAEVRLSSNGWIVRDFGSTNGTFLDNTKIGAGEWPIKNFDVIRIGNIRFIVQMLEATSPEIDGSPVGRFPISEDANEPIPAPTHTDCPHVTEATPPNPRNHPALWKVTIPGNRPLATPAIANGRVFVGGGFGSYEFYAFAADTGEQLWKYRTKDDGPTAAIVEEDLVAFNTESCELEVLTLEGTPVWKKWLGDPLMSMPAAAHGRVFIVFPDSQGDRRHYLASFHLRTGEEIWRQPINGAAITAPVLADGSVFVTTLDGTVCCFRQDDGKPVWSDARSATSSPSIWKGQCYFSRRQQTYVSHPTHQEAVQNECMSSSHSMEITATLDFGKTWSEADYLDYGMRQSDSLDEALSQTLDSTVGFQTSKGDSGMSQSRANLGHGTVAGVWSYQGSRPFVYRGRVYSCMGESVLCLDPASGNIVWKTKIVQVNQRLIDHVLTPPVLVNGKVIVGTSFGEVACLSAETGGWLWREIIGEPINFQPAVANGRIFVPTRHGSLFCLETSDAKDDGWFMWGGTAAHNGIAEAL